VTILYRSLERHGFNVGSLHGDMPQNRRTETLELFKSGQLSLLVCSDVAARGLDIAGLSHVFNFDVPISAEDYVHRIGRTGRAGRSGCAFMLATGEDHKQVASITRLIKREIPRIAPEDLEGFEGVTEEIERPSGEGEGRERIARGRDRGRERISRDNGRERVGRDDGREKVAREEGRESLTGGRVASGGVPVRRTEPPPRSSSESPRRRRRYEEDDDLPVVGFGDHMPAFLMRPARPNRDPEALAAED
jgi:superfamily II DNA/RNA helicase